MSMNKTELGLNNWAASEKPLMEEFNSDNQIVDGKLRELDKKKANILTVNTGNMLLSASENAAIRANAIYYFKDDTATVYINGHLILNSSVAKQETLVTLPTGYRPSRNLQWAFTFNETAIYSFRVNTDGTISSDVSNLSAGTYRCVASLVYPARS